MSTIVPVTLLFSDGAARRLDARCGESVVTAASEAGLNLLTDCSNGQCGTCTATLVSGAVELGHYDRAVLPEADRAAGQILTCVSKVTGPCAIELPYDLSEATAEEMPPVPGRVVSISQVAEETVRLEVEVESGPSFEPGQYVRMRPEGGSDWRSYSMANLPGDKRLVFFIRLVEGGNFSTWLQNEAKEGAVLELSEPHGSFFLRDEARPRLFVAGGTGLAPFLSMLETLAVDERQRAQRTTLLMGARTGAHLFGLSQIEALRARWPELEVRFAAETEAVNSCHTGFATDLIPQLALAQGTRVYLCGPPPMVEAGRNAAASTGLARGDMLCERFN